MLLLTWKNPLGLERDYGSATEKKIRKKRSNTTYAIEGRGREEGPLRNGVASSIAHYLYHDPSLAVNYLNLVNLT